MNLFYLDARFDFKLFGQWLTQKTIVLLRYKSFCAIQILRSIILRLRSYFCRNTSCVSWRRDPSHTAVKTHASFAFGHQYQTHPSDPMCVSFVLFNVLLDNGGTHYGIYLGKDFIFEYYIIKTYFVADLYSSVSESSPSEYWVSPLPPARSPRAIRRPAAFPYPVYFNRESTTETSQRHHVNLWEKVIVFAASVNLTLYTHRFLCREQRETQLPTASLPCQHGSLDEPICF